MGDHRMPSEHEGRLMTGIMNGLSVILVVGVLTFFVWWFVA